MRVEDNTYKLIYVDVTNRCNMKCNYCYAHNNLGKPDITKEWFEEVCKRLPKRVMFRLLGGEPTLHPDLFDLFEIAKKYGHIPTISSNGLRFRDRDYVKELSKHKRVFVGITMNGGINNDDVYEIIEGERISHAKIEALENLQEFNIKNFGISTIIMRDVNDHFIIQDFFELYRRYPIITYFKFRSASPMGRNIPSKPYDTKEYLKLIETILPKEIIYEKPRMPMKREGEVCPDCCYHFAYEKNLTVSFVEFASKKSMKCWRRGKVLTDTFEIEPFFENMEKESGNYAIQLDNLRCDK
jgi:MoaA/NifB/PqqE/SkfB family radical SAM enzyme